MKPITKFLRTIIPASIIAICAGAIYSIALMFIFSDDPSNIKNLAQITYCVGIASLGYSAACFGKKVENNPKKYGYIGAGLFAGGIIMSGIISILNTVYGTHTDVNYFVSILKILSLGVYSGIGAGILYLVPVKTLMLHYNWKGGLAGVVPILLFGLGAAVSSYMITGVVYFLHCCILQHLGTKIIESIIPHVYSLHCITFGLLYLLLLVGGIALLKTFDKPKTNNTDTNSVSNTTNNESCLKLLLSDSYFRMNWIFMFVIISIGIAFLSNIGKVASEINNSWHAETYVGIYNQIFLAVGIGNLIGRTLFPFLLNTVMKRNNVKIYAIVTLVLAMILLPILLGFRYFYNDLAMSTIFIYLILTVCYGSAFGCCPLIMANKYGTEKLSRLHGYSLSAWGSASLFVGLLTALTCVVDDSLPVYGRLLGVSTSGLFIFAIKMVFVLIAALIIHAMTNKQNKPTTGV